MLEVVNYKALIDCGCKHASLTAKIPEWHMVINKILLMQKEGKFWIQLPAYKDEEFNCFRGYVEFEKEVDKRLKDKILSIVQTQFPINKPQPAPQPQKIEPKVKDYDGFDENLGF